MVLIIDEDTTVRSLLTAVLRRDGIDPDVACDGSQAIGKLSKQSYRAVLLDLLLRQSDGLEVLRYLKQEKPEMLRRVVIVTTAPDYAVRRLSEHHLVWDVIRKPFDVDHLLEVVRACREQPGEQVN